MNDLITPDQLTAAYISGMWHGGLGVGLIIFGLLGWPRARFLLTLIFSKKPRKPIGAPTPFWEQYK